MFISSNGVPEKYNFLALEMLTGISNSTNTIQGTQRLERFSSSSFSENTRILVVFALVLQQTKVKQRELEYRTEEQVTYAHQGAKSPYSSSKQNLVFEFAGEMSCFHKKW